MVWVNPSSPQLFDAALVQLSEYRRQVGHGQKGRFVQIFLALKLYQNSLPSMHSGDYVETGILETMLDDLYEKATRPANKSVLILFSNSFRARTGITPSGASGEQNTWRNNLHIQKGIGCYAPPELLINQAFLDQSRSECQYLIPESAGSLHGATCELCLTGAKYRGEDHRKWLRIDPEGRRFALVDVLSISNYAPYVAPNGNRIPLIPLLAALYHDVGEGLPISNREVVTESDFALDFHFSPSEMKAYFDAGADAELNSAILEDFPKTAGPEVPEAADATPIADTAIPEATDLVGSPTTPPNVNPGWKAEQVVAELLRKRGWHVHDVSRQQLGYDLLAQKGAQRRFVEVKSSLGYCYPTLTAREWSQAKAGGPRYVLAIIEDFTEAGENTVYFVPDPAGSCSSKAVPTVNYSIARSTWTQASVVVDSI